MRYAMAVMVGVTAFGAPAGAEVITFEDLNHNTTPPSPYHDLFWGGVVARQDGSGLGHFGGFTGRLGDTALTTDGGRTFSLTAPVGETFTFNGAFITALYNNNQPIGIYGYAEGDLIWGGFGSIGTPTYEMSQTVDTAGATGIPDDMTPGDPQFVSANFQDVVTVIIAVYDGNGSIFGGAGPNGVVIDNVMVNEVPAPGTAAGLAVLGLAGWRRRREWIRTG